MKHLFPFLLLTLSLNSCIETEKPTLTKTSSIVGLSEETLSDSLTFWADIAPIVFENCTPCHYENGAGPFPLTTYLDLKKRSKTIRLVIADKIMPPWPADPTYTHFKDEKILLQSERNIIIAWIEQGAREGTINKTLRPKTSPVVSLGEPDQVISFPIPIEIPGTNIDMFRLAKMSFELPKDTFLRAISFKPGNKQLVHHVNGHLLNYETGKKADPYAGEWIANAELTNSLEAYNAMKIHQDDGSYPPLLVSAFNYLPGVEPVDYPGDLGNIVISKKGAFLLNTLHYGPSAKDTSDFSEIHLYFADKKPERPLSEIHLGTLGISDIEPPFIIHADSVCAFTTSYKLLEDISVLTINPHMHLLGKEIKAYAVSPNFSDTIRLIHIPKWDFRWQYFYTYPQMLKIPAGYEVVVDAIFDNTMDNPNNPFFPPKTLTESGVHMKTTDEMFQFFITYVPYKEGDEFINL